MADLHPQIESTTKPPVIVVLVPLPLHSHLNQALQLATLIASYKIPVHYATSAAHCRQAKLRFHGQNSSHVVHFQELPDPVPISSNSPTLHPSLDASLELRHPMAALFRKLSSLSERVVVIHDSNMAYVVQDIPTIPNVESYCFTCISAFSLCCVLAQGVLTGEQGSRKLLDQLPAGVEKLPQMEQTVTPEILKFLAVQSPYVNLNHGDIINTCRPLESSYLDLLRDENRGKKPQWAFMASDHRPVDKSLSVVDRDRCLVWLDKQPRKSVLFVSFGSSTSMEDEQVKELAIGLKQSKQRFLWVLKNAEKADIFREDKALKTGLPDGFEESVKEIGMVTRDWAPQVEILGHPSVGAFMSHCGWNSCMESLSMGVPIVAWPMHSEQPYNALLVTEELKAGVMVKECYENLVGSTSIKDAIEEMMLSEEGVVKRERAEELGCVLREAFEEGGATKGEVDSFIAYITR